MSAPVSVPRRRPMPRPRGAPRTEERWRCPRGGALVVDDHPALLRGLRGMLEAEGRYGPVRAAPSAMEAIALSRKYRPTLAVVDYHLPDLDGLSLGRELLMLQSPPKVVIFSAFATPRLHLSAALVGAHGVMDKSEPAQSILHKLQEVLNGGLCLEAINAEEARPSTLEVDPQDYPVLGMAMARESTADIAAVLGMAEAEVRTRIDKMVQRLRPKAEGAAPLKERP